MENNNSNTVKWISLSIIIASVIISGAIVYSNVKSKSPAGVGGQGVDISKVKMDGEPFYGKTDAPVTIAIWTDYQCPFCKKEDQQVMMQVIKDYVDSGKVKIVYKDFVFLGADSITASLAARAVWEAAPDKFEQWHEAMYAAQDAENSGWGNRADILALTKSQGIDDVKIGQLMDANKAQYQAAIDADKAEASAFGISGTPSFIIGKQLIIGAQPYATVKAAIDSALAAK